MWSGNGCNLINGSESGKTKYYLNVSEFDKSNNPLIQCNNGSNCLTIVAKVGKYINDNGSELIECTSSSNCKVVINEPCKYNIFFFKIFFHYYIIY